MNRFDWFFGQYVSQAEMDEAFWWAELADHDISVDTGLTGICAALGVTEHAAPPDLTVDVAGPGAAYDAAGQRCALADTVTVVDCAVDEYGVSTAVTVPGEERWLALFLRFKRVYSEPKVDRNGVTVYTHQDEGAEIIVRQGTAAPAGTAARVGLLSNAVLLADILLQFGSTQILNGEPPAGNISLTRREDWFRAGYAAPHVITELAAATPRSAVEQLLDILNDHVSDLGYFHGSGSLVHAWTQQWFGAEALTSATVGAALNEIVQDLAAAALSAAPPGGTGAGRIGAHGYDTLNHHVQWGVALVASVQGALEALADAIDGHVAGGAPNHPATAITFTPYSWLGTATVQAALQEVVDDLALQAGTPGAAQIGNAAIPSAGPTNVGANTLLNQLTALLAGVNARCRIDGGETVSGLRLYDNALHIVKSLVGGGQPPGDATWGLNEARLWGGLANSDHAHAYHGQNIRALPAGAQQHDICIQGHAAGVANKGDCYVVTVGARAGAAYAWRWLAHDMTSVPTEYAIPSGGGGTPVCCLAYLGKLFVLYTDGRLVQWDAALAAQDWSAVIPGAIDAANPYLNRLALNPVSGDIIVACGAQAQGAGIMFTAVNLLGAIQWSSDGGAAGGQWPDGGLACDDLGNIFASTRDFLGGAASVVYKFTSAGAAVANHALPVAGGPTPYRCHDLVFDGVLLWYPMTAGVAGNAFCGVHQVGTLNWNDAEFDLGVIVTTDPAFLVPAAQDTVNIWFGLVRNGHRILLPVNMAMCAMENLSAIPLPYGRVVTSMSGVAINELGRMAYDGHRMWQILDSGGQFVRSAPFAAWRV